jgi:hypothetical protein
VMHALCDKGERAPLEPLTVPSKSGMAQTASRQARPLMGAEATGHRIVPRGQQPARAGFYRTLGTVFAELGHKVNLRTSCRYLLDLVALSRGVVSVESSSTVSQPLQRFFLRIARIPGKSTPPFPSS